MALRWEVSNFLGRIELRLKNRSAMMRWFGAVTGARGGWCVVHVAVWRSSIAHSYI
jgi:hypothetical protein